MSTKLIEKPETVSKNEMLKHINDAASQFGTFNLNENPKSVDRQIIRKSSQPGLKGTLSKNNLNSKALESLKMMSPGNDYAPSLHSAMISERSLAQSHFVSQKFQAKEAAARPVKKLDTSPGYLQKCEVILKNGKK